MGNTRGQGGCGQSHPHWVADGEDREGQFSKKSKVTNAPTLCPQYLLSQKFSHNPTHRQNDLRAWQFVSALFVTARNHLSAHPQATGRMHTAGPWGRILCTCEKGPTFCSDVERALRGWKERKPRAEQPRVCCYLWKNGQGWRRGTRTCICLRMHNLSRGGYATH